MTPTGPFGFPRLTDLGPFVEGEMKRFRVITDSSLSGTMFQQQLAEEGYIHSSDEDAKKVKAHAGFNGSSDTLSNENMAGSMTYKLPKNSDIAIIDVIAVDESMRGKGIGTSLKTGEMGFMREQGVKKVFTTVTSESGYRLAIKTGFEPSNEFGFDLGGRRGTMKREI